jgi:putative transposase
MSRLACPQLPGVPLHLVLRGGPPERAEAYRERLRGALESPLHAYALMGTHVHLLLTPSRAGGAMPLVRALRAASFDASPVFTRRYVLACMRCIELNPVRAALVRDPARYRWSSYRANALGEPDELVTPHALYCALGRSAEERQRAYRRSFAAGVRSPARRPAC